MARRRRIRTRSHRKAVPTSELGDWFNALDTHLTQLGKWTAEVTKMLRKIDWDKLEKDYKPRNAALGDPQNNPPPWPPK